MFALTFCDCFVHLFKGGAPRVVARVRGAQPCIRRFFCQLFFEALFAKEKRLNGFAIKTVITLFLLKQEAQKKKLCKKKMPFFALTPRRRPLLKKRSKTTALVRANKVRDKPQFINLNTQIILLPTSKYCQSVGKIHFFYLLIRFFVVQ